MKHLSFLLLIFCCIGVGTAQNTSAIDNLLLDARYDEAVKLADQSLASANDAVQKVSLQNKKAEALIRLGKFDDAENILKEASTSSVTPSLQGVTQTNYGLLYLIEGRNDRALESLEKALTLFEQDNKSESLEAAQALSHLGNLYRATGKFAQAEEQLNRALDIRQKLLSQQHELIAASYNDLGLVYSTSNPDKALDYYEKALAIYKTLHGNDHPKIATATTNVGFIYRNLELYGDAVNNFESALKIWEKVYSQPHSSKAFVLFNLGATYLKMGDQKAAHGYYDRALKMYEDSYGKKHPEIARVYNAIGDLELANSNYTVALSTYQHALQANVSDFDNSNINVDPPLKNFYDGNVLLNSMLSKAQAFEARHFGKTLRFQDLTMALKTLHRCDTLIDKLRQQINNESDKIALGAVATEVYANGVRISYEAAQVALKKKDLFESAFYFAEKSKSAVLLEAISDANAKSFAGIPADLLEEEKNLKSAIALCAQKLAQKPSSEEEKYLRETSFNLNRQYEAFTRKLEQQFPEYFNLKFNATAPTTPELQSKLDDQSELISYFTDEKNNRLYIFQITHNKFHISDVALPKEFDRYITGLRNGMYFNDLKTYGKSATALSSLLLPEHIPNSIKSLIIIPVGRLGIIPFEALLTKTPKEFASYNDLPYLISQYSVRYEFSAGLILQKKKSAAANKSNIFLCAPVTFMEKDNLGDLPGTESEVKEISSLFAAKNFDSKLYTRKNADEKIVKSPELKSYNYIHFATHGIVDENNPELSRIYLQTDAASEDGNLFAGEIYNLNLDASLVTLSACETGLGKISRGEGVIGLSRALVYAGAKSIIVSFWSVADESTALLMKDFYKQLLQGNTPQFSENLRQAKLDLIHDKKYAAPYYWAPFILIGF